MDLVSLQMWKIVKINKQRKINKCTQKNKQISKCMNACTKKA